MSGFRPPPAFFRPGIRQLGRRVLDPALTWEEQRRRFEAVMRASPVPRGTRVTTAVLNGVATEVVTGGQSWTGRRTPRLSLIPEPG